MVERAPKSEVQRGRSLFTDGPRHPALRSEDLTSFVGRRSELEELAALMHGPARLISVIGPPGIGKTRTVRRLLETVDNACFFCDLRGVDSPEELCAALAESLDGHLETGAQLPALANAVGQLLASRGPTVVVLDNFEQLVPLGTEPLGHWLREAPETTFLVTSRRLLRLQAERGYELEPLGLPAAGDATSDAVELFVDRARATEPAFDASAQEAIHALVWRLEGLPLVLELAAGQMRWLKPGELLRQLGERPALTLVADARDVDPRHASLRAAIDTSWNLLEPHERCTLAQLAVCRQGFSLEAAEAIVDLSAFPAAPPVRTAVASLREAMLLRVDERARTSGPQRWDMFEAIRSYASESPTDGAEARHVAYYRGYGVARVAKLATPAGADARGELALELANFQAATDYATRPGSALFGDAADLALIQYEIHRLSRPALGIRPLTLALGIASDAAGTDERRVQLLIARGACFRCSGEVARARSDFEIAHSFEGSDPLLAAEIDVEQAALLFWSGDIHEARALLRRTVDTAVQHGAHNLEIRARCWLGQVLNQGFQDPEAFVELDQALTLARAAGDVGSQSTLRIWRVVCHLFQGGMGDPAEEIQAQLTTARRLQDRETEALAEQLLGICHLDRGEPKASRTHLLRSLDLSRLVGLRRHAGCTAYWLGCLHQQAGVSERTPPSEAASPDDLATIGDLRSEAYAALTSVTGAARAGDLGHAHALLDRGEAIGHRFGEEAVLALTLIQRARLQLVESLQCARRNEQTHADRLLYEAEQHVEIAKRQVLSESSDHAERPLVLHRSPEGRWALRCYEAELGALAADRRVLWVWADGRRLRLDDGPTSELPPGSVVCEALRALLDRHVTAPGQPTSMEDMTAQCWPGERMSSRVRSQRVRQVVTRLRKAGLQGLLHHNRAGYFLDRSVAVRRMEPAARDKPVTSV